MPDPDRILQSLSFPASYLDAGESIVREKGLDVAEFYQFCGVTYPRVALPWQTINGKQMQRAMARFLQTHTAGVPPLVSYMAHCAVTTHGPIGVLAITARNMGEALQGALDYSSLVMPAYAMRRHDVHDQVHMVFERQHDFGEVNDFFTETVVAAFLQIGPFLSRLPTHLPEVHFRHAPLGPVADYEQAFNARFLFNSQQDKIVLAREDLSIPLLAPSRTSHMLMKATLEQQQQLRPQSRPVTQEVRRLLNKAVRENLVIDLAKMAHTLAMSARTLSRRLQQEGTTLPQLRAEASIAYAEVLLLETSKSILQIANASGFQDAAAFTRAFRRGTGRTPTQLRQGTRREATAPSSAPATWRVEHTIDR